MKKETLAIAIAAGFVFAFGGFAASADEGADKLFGFEKTGSSKSCLRSRQVRDSDPLDDHNILFEVAGGKLYLNKLNKRCTGLMREGRFAYRSPQAQICKGDIISVTDNFGTFRGSCALGQFEQVVEASEPAPQE